MNSLQLRKNSKRKAYSVIRSFFMHNRCALPYDPTYRIRGNIAPVESKLTVRDVQEAVYAANTRYRSIILFKWQSFLDSKKLITGSKRVRPRPREDLLEQISELYDLVRQSPKLEDRSLEFWPS